MSGRGHRKSNIIETNFETEIPRIVETEIMAEETVELTLLKDLILNVTGKVTGKKYTFNGAGSRVLVDKQDIEWIMNKNRTISCCGSTASPYFELA